MMKPILIFLLFVLPFSTAAQCSMEEYQILLKEAKTAQKKGQYDLAINKLSSARACRPEKDKEIEGKILEVLKKEKKKKELEKKNAEEAKRQTNETANALKREEVLRRKAEQSVKINRMAVMAMDNKNIDFTLAWHQSVWAYKSS